MELFLLPFQSNDDQVQFQYHIQYIEHLKSVAITPTLLSCFTDDLFITYHEMDCHLLLETLFLDLGYTHPYLHGVFEYDTPLIRLLATKDVWRNIAFSHTRSIDQVFLQLAHNSHLQTATLALLDDTLIITLQHYFKNNLNVIQTAKEMYVHRNSLNYRLSQIHLKTGIDPRTFYGAMYFFQVIHASTSE